MTRVGPRLLVCATIVVAACTTADQVVVTEAWARASTPGQSQGAVYFDLTVADDDRLVGAAVEPSVANRAEIHEAVMDETGAEAGSHDMGDAGGTSDGSGVTRMQHLTDGLALSGGDTVSFEPGSLHVMLAELSSPLVAGDEFELTLDFAEADDVMVVVEIADTAP